MSDDKKINWHPPMKAPQVNYLEKFKLDLNKPFNADWMKNSLWYKTMYAPKSPNSKATGATSPLALQLCEDWRSVMKAEATVKQNKVKIDPNISLKFFEELTETAKRLNCSPEDLAAIIYGESHFDPQIKNSTGKYTGLIQMDKRSFDSLQVDNKCTYEEYCKLPREKQLKYVEAYLKYRIEEKGLTGKKLSGGQLWTLIKRPASIHDNAFVKRQQKHVDALKREPSKYN